MSLSPVATGLDQIAERLEREALDNGHDIGEGFEPAEVIDVPGFLRMECRACHEVAYIGPGPDQVNPMNPGKCRGRVVISDLTKEEK